MKRNRNITQEALNEAWRQKQLRGEPGNIVFVDGIAWEHTDLSAEELAKKYNENKVVIEQDNNFFQFLLNIQIDYPNERTVNNNIAEPLFNTIRSNFLSRFVYHSGNSGRANENYNFNFTFSSRNSFGGGGGATAGW